MHWSDFNWKTYPQSLWISLPGKADYRMECALASLFSSRFTSAVCDLSGKIPYFLPGFFRLFRFPAPLIWYSVLVAVVILPSK